MYKNDIDVYKYMRKNIKLIPKGFNLDNIFKKDIEVNRINYKNDWHQYMVNKSLKEISHVSP